jgi:hypothetical protein
VSSLTLNSLSIRVAPGSMTASANGTVSGMAVSVAITSATQPSSPGLRLSSIRVTSSSGRLDALLASQSSLVSSDLGFSVPPAAAPDAADTSRTTAEMVFDNINGLRMLNVSMGPTARLGVADLARRIGFSWQGSGSDSSEVLAFTGAQLYYVPNKPGAPALVWGGQTLKAGELGVSSMVDIPPLGIIGMRATLLVQSGGRLFVEVSHHSTGCLQCGGMVGSRPVWWLPLLQQPHICPGCWSSDALLLHEEALTGTEATDLAIHASAACCCQQIQPTCRPTVLRCHTARTCMSSATSATLQHWTGGNCCKRCATSEQAALHLCRPTYTTWAMLLQAASVTPSAFPAVALSALTINITAGSMLATATGNVSGIPVAAELISIAQPGANASQRLGGIKITANTGLERLLFSQARGISQDLGITVPAPSATPAPSTPGISVTAEVVFESGRGLRMLSFGMSSATGSLGLADLARSIGFSWRSDSSGTEMVLLRSAQLIYVPRRAGASTLTWNGQVYNPDLSIAATVDLPGLSLSGVKGLLLVQSGGKLTMQVGRQ